MHSEAVFGLRGAQREKTILLELLDKLVAMQRRVLNSQLLHSVTMEFSTHRLLELLTALFIIGRDLFLPQANKAVTSIASIAAMRAEVSRGEAGGTAHNMNATCYISLSFTHTHTRAHNRPATSFSYTSSSRSQQHTAARVIRYYAC